MERRVRRCQDGLHFGHCVTGSSRSSPATYARYRDHTNYFWELPRVTVRVNAGQRRDTSGYEGGPKSTHIPKTFPSDQCLDPNLVALRCLRVERAMGIEPTGATAPTL
jgi:hypothetical protein